jgi:tetratricopeptide (TPR) repeat protein
MYFKQQKYAESLKEYRQALILDPANNQAAGGVKDCRARLNEQIQKYLDLGMQQYNNGEYNKALETFQKVQEIDPDQPIAKDYVVKSAEMYEKNKTVIQQKESLDKGKESFVNRDFATAKRYFQKVVDVDAKNDAGREAADYLARCDENIAKSSKEDMIAQRFTQGIIDFKNQKYDKAVSNWRTIKEIDPENKFVDSYIQLASTAQQERGNKNYQDGLDAFKRGDMLAARDNFTKAIQVDPKHQKAKEFLSKVNTQILAMVQSAQQKANDALNAGRYTEAIVQFGDVLKYEPENEAVSEQKAVCEEILDLVNKGQSALQNREYADAFDYFDRVLSLNANDKDAEINRNRAGEEGRKQATQWLSEAEQFLNSGDLRKAQSRLSAVLKGNPANQQARDRLREVEDLIESQIRSTYQRALDYYNAGKWSLALQEFNKVLDLRNPYKDAFSYKEKALREKSKVDAQASASMKQEIERYIESGREHYRLGELDAAIADWEKVAQMDPNNKDIQGKIARAKYRRSAGE